MPIHSSAGNDSASKSQFSNSASLSSGSDKSSINTPQTAGDASSTTSSTASQVVTVSVCIPEGYTVSQIGTLLESNGVCKKAGFLATVNSYDFSYYKLVSKIPSDSNRCYKLEGYLFPDTYEFYIDMKAQDVLGRMIRGAENHIVDYSYPDMTIDQIITLASILSKETGDPSQLGKISSVFHNRLKAGMKLQADSTIYYIERYVKPNLSDDINRYNSYYNTYKCAALPAGPICNPGDMALKAAVSPDDTDYLYFVVDNQRNYYYAATYEEHLKNCKQAGITDESDQSQPAA